MSSIDEALDAALAGNGTVVLGDGKRLFGPTSDKKRLRLADSKTVGDGVLILTYERGV